MTPEQVLSHPARVLSQKQRDSYFANGYLLVENAVAGEWIERLRSVTSEMVDRSRAMKKSDAVFDLEPGHTAGAFRHPTYCEVIRRSLAWVVRADGSPAGHASRRRE